MSYTALYRKFRPSTFEDVKGQDHIVTTVSYTHLDVYKRQELYRITFLPWYMRLEFV